MNTSEANEPSLNFNRNRLPDLESIAGFAEFAFDAVVMCDFQERITYWNPAAGQLYGWTSQEALGRTPAELFWPVSTPQEQENQRQRQSKLERGETLRGEHNSCRKDGSSFWVQYVAHATFSADGKFTGYLAIYRDISAQRQTHEKKQGSPTAEEPLPENEHKFSILFDKVGFAAALAKLPHGLLVDVNEAWVNIFGYTRQEALGKSTLELGINPDVEGRARILAQLEERGSARDLEMTLQTKSGEWRSFLTNVDIVEIGGQKYFFSTVQDITERKQKEDFLRARTEEIETLLQVSPVAIFVAHDPECVHITGNPAGYRMVGMHEDSGMNISKSAPTHEQPTYRVFRNGVEVRAEDMPMQKAARLGVEVNEDALELRFDNGAQKFIYAFARPLFDSQGKSRGAIAAMLDITERKRDEERLERSHQKLSEILVSIQDDFYVLDRNWVFVYANKLFTSRIGKEPEAFVGNNIWEMFPKHVGSALEENFRAAMEKREIRRFEIPGKYTNAWYRMTAFPSAEGITVLGTDITDRKRAEDALREHEKRLQLLNETLEQKVQQKTAEVRRLASELIKATQRERHRISHILHDDLQQRIYAIRMQLTFLHDTLEGENTPARQEVSGIEKQLNDVLDIARQLSIDLSPPILRDEGLTQAINWLAGQMRKQYGLSIELQANESFAIASEELHVLLFNCVRELLFNIVKHAQASEVVVALKWLDAGLQIEVRDNGKGFPVNTSAPHVDEEGEIHLSLGLPTIRHQLSLFGGRMEIESNPEVGTRAILIVPVAGKG